MGAVVVAVWGVWGHALTHSAPTTQEGSREVVPIVCVYRVPHESHGVGVGVGEVFVDGCECRGDKGFRYDQTGHMAISTEQAPIYPLVCPLPPLLHSRTVADHPHCTTPLLMRSHSAWTAMRDS